MSTDTPAAAKAHLQALERERRRMTLANRYLAAGKKAMLEELGYDALEIRRLELAGGFTATQFARMRETIHYYKVKSKRKLWRPTA